MDERFHRRELKELRKKGEDHADLERSKWGNDHTPSPWMVYRTDAREYVSAGLLELNFPTAEFDIPKFFEAQHKAGKKVLVFDICGIADAKSLGADYTVCLTRSTGQTFDKKTQEESELRKERHMAK